MAATAGMLRYNTDNKYFERSTDEGSTWAQLDLSGTTGLGYATKALDNLASVQIQTDLVFHTNQVIRRDTSDGSDNGSLYFCGGGGSGADQTRGSYIAVFGNEQGATGGIRAYLGNVSGAQFIVYRGAGTETFKVNGDDGSVTFTSSNNAAPWLFNNTHTNGGHIYVQRSGNAIVQLGTGASIGYGGSSDGCLRLYGTGQLVVATWPTNVSAANAVLVDGVATNRSTSSKRYKDIIGPNPYGLKEILQLSTYIFEGKEDRKGSLGKWQHLGLIAEEMDEIIPNLVGYKNIGTKKNPIWVPDYIEYDYLCAPFINSFKEINTRLERLEHGR